MRRVWRKLSIRYAFIAHSFVLRQDGFELSVDDLAKKRDKCVTHSYYITLC